MAIPTAASNGVPEPLTDEAGAPESRFDSLRRQVGFVLGPLVFIGLIAAPFGLADDQRMLAAVLGLVVVYWVSEAIPVPATALVGLALCALLGVAPPSDVLAGFATPTIFLFIGSFILARGMTIHGLDRRFALRVLSIGGIADSTYGTLIAFGLVAAVLSAFISNTAATAMLLPIGIGIIAVYRRLSVERDNAAKGIRQFSVVLMLMIAYSASVGGLLTPIGSPPNLLGRGFLEEQAGVSLPFLRWVLIAAPIVGVALIALFAVLLFLNRPEMNHVSGATDYCRSERRGLGPLSAGERNTLIAFVLAVSLWLLPGIVGLLAGEASDAYALVRSRLDEGIVALVAASLLFVLPTDRRLGAFTLNWRQAVQIDWGTIILFGGGIAFGSLLSSTGLAGLIGSGLAGMLGNAGPLSLTLMGVFAAVIVSETTSNTASVGIVVPVVISICGAMGIDPAVPGLAAVFGASFGFMLPVSTPPNAIVYGSGMVPMTRMIRSGIVFDILGALVITAGVTIMAALVGVR